MRQLLKTVFAGTAAVVIASVVLAQNPAPDAASTQPKAAQAQQSVFQKMDKNNDGKVTAEEHQARLKEWFKELDKNGDGKISAEEFDGARFVEIDVNKDGTVTVEEYLVFFVGNDAPAKAGKIAESDTLYPKGANEITGVEVIGYRKSVYKAINASGDGKVTPDELKAYNNKEFEFLDKNKDGFVTVDEISAVALIPVFASKTAEKKAAPPAEK